MRPRTFNILASGACIIGIADVSCRAQCEGPGRVIAVAPPGSGFGFCVSALGDTNGNGTPDFAVGAPYENGYGTARVYEGEGLILRGIKQGDFSGDRFGSAIAFGDFLGFGLLTLSIGSPGSQPGTGAAGLYDNEDFGFVYPLNFGNGSGFGYSFATVTLLGGLGVNAVTLAMGSEFGNLVTFAHPSFDVVEVTHGNTYQGFGRCIAPIADVTGDGIPDVAISAELEDSTFAPAAGRIYLYSGASLLPNAAPNPQPLWIAEGTQGAGRLGHCMVDVGDVNGDGVPDLAAGSPRCGGSPCPAGLLGSVRIFSGVNGTLLRTIPSPPGILRFGKSLVLVGDMNGDGHSDLAVGVPDGPDGDYASGGPGRVVIVSPMDGSVLNTIYGLGWGRNFGWSIATAGDLNSDGLLDLAVGAPAVDLDAPGRVHVLTSLNKPAPTIDVQPSNACPGSTVVFTATTSLPQPLAYRWFEQLPYWGSPLTPLVNGPTGRGSIVSGANTASLSIAGVVGGDQGAQYTCVVYDPTLAPEDQCASWVVSPEATLRISLTPTVSISPSPASSCAPNAFVLTATDGTCSPSTTLSWEYRATLPATTNWITAIDGVNSALGSASMVFAGASSTQVAIIPLSPSTFNSAGIEVRCVGTNAHGSAGSNSSRLIWTGVPPAITTQPTAMTLCRVGEATTGILTEGDGLQYRWQIEDATIPNVWHDLSDGVLPSELQFCAYASQTQSSVLLLGTYSQCYGPGQPHPSRRVRAIVSNGCGAATSLPASISICFADLDDGTWEGQCDGGVDINDLLFFLNAFERGDVHADLDDGNGLGSLDHGVDINDLLFFLAHFETGC